MSKKQFTLAALTKDLDVEIQGDANSVIHSVSTIQQATPGSITFLMNPRYKKYLKSTQATAVILSKSDAVECDTNAVICQDPYYTYARIAAYFKPELRRQPGVHSTVIMGKHCQIHPTAEIGPYVVLGDHVVIEEGAIIGPHCTIGQGTQIGEYSRLDANVTVYHGVIIGKHVIISSGTVIGSDGFGVAKHKGQWHKVPQLGGVVIGDHVEIGAHCAIDRGAIEDTIIEKGVQLDNLIQVGHNVRIGENTAIAGCTGVAGSAVIGKNCLIGGGTGINGHITVADNVIITGMSMITKSISESGVYSSGVGGVMTNEEWRKNTARVNRLDNLMQRVKTLEEMTKEREK